MSAAPNEIRAPQPSRLGRPASFIALPISRPSAPCTTQLCGGLIP
jgi:hypothetical protein